MFSIQILVNSKIFKLSCNLFLTHLRAQIVYYELKVDLSPVMLKEIFHHSFENFENFTRICIENHASATGWQKLFFSYKCFQLLAAVAIATFEILRLPIFNTLFQLVLTKFFKSELFSFLLKVDHVVKSYPYVSLNYFLVDINLVLFFFPHYFSSVHPSASRAELIMMTVSEIVNQLITAHEKGNDVNLNK